MIRRKRPRRSEAAINAPTRPIAPWRVVTAEPLPGFRLRVTFVDGTSGEVELEGRLRSEKVLGTVFEPLRQTKFFARATVTLGAVGWPNGADLAPDAMYDAIRQNGRWVLS
jgi:Protein of unknown function (DUF2442)